MLALGAACVAVMIFDPPYTQQGGGHNETNSSVQSAIQVGETNDRYGTGPSRFCNETTALRDVKYSFSLPAPRSPRQPKRRVARVSTSS